MIALDGAPRRPAKRGNDMRGDRTTHVPAVLASAVFLFGVLGRSSDWGPGGSVAGEFKHPFRASFFSAPSEPFW